MAPPPRNLSSQNSPGKLGLRHHYFIYNDESKKSYLFSIFIKKIIFFVENISNFSSQTVYKHVDMSLFVNKIKQKTAHKSLLIIHY